MKPPLTTNLNTSSDHFPQRTMGNMCSTGMVTCVYDKHSVAKGSKAALGTVSQSAEQAGMLS